jgi:aspartate/glutamate racemase
MPDSARIEQTTAVIYRVMAGTLAPEDQAMFYADCVSFVEERELDGVILGCTELPLAMGDRRDDRVLDTLRVLSDVMLARYYEPVR